MTLPKKLSSRPSRGAYVYYETTGDDGKGIAEVESGEATQKILRDSSLYWK